VVEQRTFNPLAVGSNPTALTHGVHIRCHFDRTLLPNIVDHARSIPNPLCIRVSARRASGVQVSRHAHEGREGHHAHEGREGQEGRPPGARGPGGPGGPPGQPTGAVDVWRALYMAARHAPPYPGHAYRPRGSPEPRGGREGARGPRGRLSGHAGHQRREGHQSREGGVRGREGHQGGVRGGRGPPGRLSGHAGRGRGRPDDQGVTRGARG